MKGKVLGYDAASGTGAINGDDGQRYTFTTTDYKNPVPAKANDSVDFEADGGAAKNIYVVKTGFSMPPIGTPGGAAPVAGGTVAGGDFVEMIKAKPYVIWAAIVILGSLIGGYFSTLNLIGGGPMGIFGFAGFILALLILVPISAGVLIFFELTNHPMTSLGRLAAGAIAVGGPILLPVLAGMLLPGMMGAAVSMGGGFGFSFSPGMVITVAGGVLILLTHFGIMPQKLG